MKINIQHTKNYGMMLHQWDWKQQNSRIDETKSWIFEKKINKIDKPLVTLTKVKRDKVYIIKIKSETEDINTGPITIKRLVSE